jgi:O-antigen ligase
VEQFGPFHYRANAAQYLNLVWPVCLGFWWTLRFAGPNRSANHLLLVCAAIIAACPIISTSRGGAMITVCILGLATVSLIVTQLVFRTRHREDNSGNKKTLGLFGLFVAAALLLGFAFGWNALQPRIGAGKVEAGFKNRELIYQTARPMAADYPLFGTGPGTFESVFLLYRISTETYWPAQLHNDWLETRITFGWAGSLLIGLALLLVLMHWFFGPGIHGGRRFVLLVWLALGGCLVHARYDFPFQVYSIVHLFLLLCAILFVVTRK